MEPSALEIYARVCGWTLAKAHARSGDAVAIASYVGTSRRLRPGARRVRRGYADQNERDYDALQQAVESGRVAVQTGL